MLKKHFLKNQTWRAQARHAFDVQNTMPDFYSAVWDSKKGKQIAMKIIFDKAFTPILKILKKKVAPAFRKLKAILYEIGQNLCENGNHHWHIVSREKSSITGSITTIYTCLRCPATKKVKKQ